jgi:hypothetical protein
MVGTTIGWGKHRILIIVPGNSERSGFCDGGSLFRARYCSVLDGYRCSGVVAQGRPGRLDASHAVLAAPVGAFEAAEAVRPALQENASRRRSAVVLISTLHCHLRRLATSGPSMTNNFGMPSLGGGAAARSEPSSTHHVRCGAAAAGTLSAGCMRSCERALLVRWSKQH